MHNPQHINPAGILANHVEEGQKDSAKEIGLDLLSILSKITQDVE
jgi:hypothetical protein